MVAAQFLFPGQGTHPSAPVFDNGSQVAPALENCPLLERKLFIYGCAGLCCYGVFSLVVVSGATFYLQLPTAVASPVAEHRL